MNKVRLIICPKYLGLLEFNPGIVIILLCLTLNKCLINELVSLVEKFSSLTVLDPVNALIKSRFFV